MKYQTLTTGREIFLRILESINSGRMNLSPLESVDDAIKQYNKLTDLNAFKRFHKMVYKNGIVGSRDAEYKPR